MLIPELKVLESQVKDNGRNIDKIDKKIDGLHSEIVEIARQLGKIEGTQPYVTPPPFKGGSSSGGSTPTSFNEGNS